MAVVKMTHPNLPGRVRSVQQSAFRVWEKQGWEKAPDDAKVTNDSEVRKLTTNRTRRPANTPNNPVESTESG